MTAAITADALLAELAGGSEWNVNEYSVDAASELVRRGVAIIETRNVLFGRKRGGKEFSRTEVKVRAVDEGAPLPGNDHCSSLVAADMTATTWSNLP